MPVREADPWRLQYFVDAACPADVEVPTEDSDAWLWNPAHRWVYDKIAVAQSQGLDAGPHGTSPPRFPVFSKPIINLRGMGIGSRILRNAVDYQRHHTAGHMWMLLLKGEHISSDVAVVDGVPRWWRHVTGKPAGEGTFDFWTVHAASNTVLEQRCGAWIRDNLAGYTGMLNLETIGGVIIEAHLRMSDQWPDLYGKGWVAAVIRLHQRAEWNFPDPDRQDGFSVVLFGAKDRRYRHPPRSLVEEISRMPGVSSLQITFHEDRDPEWHAMPPGGFRLAIVNCWDLATGQAARDRLCDHFMGEIGEPAGHPKLAGARRVFPPSPLIESADL
jgi:hypothetical protein